MTDEPQKSRSARKQEDWMNRKWRPAMAWLYLVVCTADFIVFPIIWAIFKAYVGTKGADIEAWQPLTLQGAGLFHLAMGAVLGIAAWSRGKEKIVGAQYHREYDDSYYNDFGYRNKFGRRPRQEEEREI
jgi:hypothetical protein